MTLKQFFRNVLFPLLVIPFIVVPIVVVGITGGVGCAAKEEPLPTLESVNPAKTRIVIEKSRYRLKLYEGDRLLRNYPVVFGFDAVNDKMQEGDGCTPEGVFHAKMCYDHKKYSKFIWVDYPNESSWEKFKRNKAAGKIPADATIGGEIGIHGTPPNFDNWVGEKYNWTWGCISLTRPDVDELYPLVQEGTEILIQH